jgi:hypothetical protein
MFLLFIFKACTLNMCFYLFWNYTCLCTMSAILLSLWSAFVYTVTFVDCYSLFVITPMFALVDVYFVVQIFGTAQIYECYSHNMAHQQFLSVTFLAEQGHIYWLVRKCSSTYSQSHLQRLPSLYHRYSSLRPLKVIDKGRHD